MIQEGAHDGLAFCVRFVRESRWKWWILTGRGIDKNHNSNSHLHSTFQVSRHLDIFTSLDSSYGLIVRPGINYYPPSREENAERRDASPLARSQAVGLQIRPGSVGLAGLPSSLLSHALRSAQGPQKYQL